MFLIVPSVVVSVVLVSVIYALARSRHGTAGVCWLTAVTTVPFLFIGSPALLLHSVGSLVLALACAAFRLGPKAVLSASMGAMVASYGLVLSMSLGELRELEQLRAEYPLESMTGRLAYEEPIVEHGLPAPVLNGKIEQRLSNFEQGGRSNSRSYMLASLHNRTQDEFVMASGFGPVRMLRVRQERVRLPETPPVPLPLPPEPEPYSPSKAPPPLPLALPQTGDHARPSVSALLTMHDGGLEDFFNSERMGYIKDRNRVAGFEPHRFLAVPQVPDKEPATSPWQVVRLELVSLLKHETPVAYVSEYLPQMDKLKDAATRPLSGFERTALDRLRTAEDLVIDESPNRIRMLGSLRAGKNCLECHSVQRGELLGAFSYELVPEQPIRVPEDDGKPLGPQA
jgi:hypothetical protein